MSCTFAVTTTGPVAVVSVDGELDAEQTGRFRRLTAQLVARGHPHLVLDLARTTLLDCSALGALATLARAADAVGGRVALAGLSRRHRELLGVFDLLAPFVVRESVAAAEDELRPLAVAGRPVVGQHPGHDL